MATDWKSRALNPRENSNGSNVGTNDWRSRAVPLDNAAFERSEEQNGEGKSWETTAGNVGKQFVKETVVNAGGTYGDLLGLVGIGPNKEAEEKKNTKDFEILERMEQPGYKPTYEDLYDLTSDPYAPVETYLPTSEGLRGAVEGAGGPGEPEGYAEKSAARSGQLYGGGLAFGQVNPVPAVAAGTAGQTVEEFGGGPLLQAGIEIATLLVTAKKPGVKVSSLKTEAQAKIDELRKLGYSEEDITLAINTGRTKLAKLASKGKKTENAFEEFTKNSDKIIDDILTTEVTGLKEGTKKVHELASEVYGDMVKDSKLLTIQNSKPFEDATKRVTDHLNNSLGTNADAAAFIKRLNTAAEEATKSPSAEKMVNFYKELNGMGKWLGRREKDKLINEVKNGIKDTFKGQGKIGEDFLAKFEEANKGIKKAYDAEELVDLIGKSKGTKETNYNRLKSTFDDPENYQLLESVVGDKQAKNIKIIAKTGSEVKDFDKSWKKANTAFTKYGFAAGATAAFGYSFWKAIIDGDYGALAKVVTVASGKAAGQKVLEKFLRDPKYQNLLIQGAHAIKSENGKLMKSANEAITKYHEENIE